MFSEHSLLILTMPIFMNFHIVQLLRKLQKHLLNINRMPPTTSRNSVLPGGSGDNISR